MTKILRIYEGYIYKINFDAMIDYKNQSANERLNIFNTLVAQTRSS